MPGVPLPRAVVRHLPLATALYREQGPQGRRSRGIGHPGLEAGKNAVFLGIESSLCPKGAMWRYEKKKEKREKRGGEAAYIYFYKAFLGRTELE